MPVTLKIWHTVRHDDATVTEISVASENLALGIIEAARDAEVFVHNVDTRKVVVPWSRINYFEIVEEP